MVSASVRKGHREGPCRSGCQACGSGQRSWVERFSCGAHLEKVPRSFWNCRELPQKVSGNVKNQSASNRRSYAFPARHQIGTLLLRSAPGKGATVILELPRASAKGVRKCQKSKCF